jgi:hypothetical protein
MNGRNNIFRKNPVERFFDADHLKGERSEPIHLLIEFFRGLDFEESFHFTYTISEWNE